MKGLYLAVALATASVSVSGCKTAQEHSAAVREAEPQTLTVGVVQKEIRVGMSGGEVAQVLGSPNIVSTDENSLEVWIYDRISTHRVYSESRGGITALILGGAIVGSGLAGAGAAPGFSEGAGASSTTQKTLTVVIKFDAEKKVRNFSYHTSRF